MTFVISSATYRRLTAALYYSIICLFLAGVAMSILYQAGYALGTNPHMPFMEPDNYEYYLFAQMAVAHPALTQYNITNPYLIGAGMGFFEHPGLYLMPVYLYDILHLPMVWEFRILQLLATFVIYLISLLIAKKVLDALPVDKVYHWLAYTIIATSFLLMQYTSITEWRGNEFISAIGLVAVYLMAWIYTKRSVPLMGLSWIPAVSLVLLAEWIWSGGVVLIPLIITLYAGCSMYMYIIRRFPSIWRYTALAVVIGAVAVFFFPTRIDGLIGMVTGPFGITGCASNPLHIGELECLTASNGLVAILMMMVFGSFSLAAYMGDTIMSNKKNEYEYYLLGVFLAGFLMLPLALIYIRLLSLIAPYFTIMYALGIVAMLSYFGKTGSNRIILFLTIILILLSSFVGQYLFYLSNMTLYSLANPAGLVNATAFMNAQGPNMTVLAYYGYGDYLEAYGHLHTYADTVQGLKYTTDEKIDRVFSSNASMACGLIMSFKPAPYFIMEGSNMLNSTLFVNVSNDSILKSPNSFNNACGYGLVYNQGGFKIFEHK